MSTAEPTEQPYTVVVGVSATSKSPTALEWAAAQADAFDGRLVAVRVWNPPTAGSPTTSGVTASRLPDLARMEEEQRERLAADVRDVLGDDHRAEARLVRGGRRKALLDEAEDADLLVIDAPRAPSMSPLLAQRIVYAAACPVVVMPPRISGQPESGLARAGRAVGRSAVRSLGTAGRAGYRPPPRP